ncbi:uncharacterized protein BHQ10_003846 [Talaromyces amestolkiae]|uniref:Uncharacterized protein n=1 Tax=Talaromyces amestolkiae TaxID=1196081 RepID=A0A364KWB1_TALAM|nr:uncharacterized protein BHQ10_003846 [Talaromyces amestolkiae]RAO67834.1 hypothetical protein BHQ10_003846 [Talaromyces amestolkiae]
MGLIKSALLLGGGIYAVKKITKSQEKKHEMQKNNNNNNQDMYMYGGGHLGQNQQYSQPQSQYQQQQQRPGQGYNYNGTRDGSYPAPDYNKSRGQSPHPAWEHPPQSQYGYAGNGHDDFPPAYIAQDEKKRMK